MTDAIQRIAARKAVEELVRSTNECKKQAREAEEKAIQDYWDNYKGPRMTQVYEEFCAAFELDPKDAKNQRGFVNHLAHLIDEAGLPEVLKKL